MRNSSHSNLGGKLPVSDRGAPGENALGVRLPTAHQYMEASSSRRIPAQKSETRRANPAASTIFMAHGTSW